jgi:hypothetical protein
MYSEKQVEAHNTKGIEAAISIWFTDSEIPPLHFEVNMYETRLKKMHPEIKITPVPALFTIV